MILLSLILTVVKLSYDSYSQKRLQSIHDYNDAMDFDSLRKFFTAIKYLDIVLLQMASITFISRLSAVSPKIFGGITAYIDFTMGSNRLLQIVGVSLYNTFAVAVFTTFLYGYYQLKAADVLYSMVRTLLLFINGFYLQTNDVFLHRETFESVVAQRTVFLSLINVVIVRLISTFMVFNSIVAEHLSQNKLSRDYRRIVQEAKEKEMKINAENLYDEELKKNQKPKRTFTDMLLCRAVDDSD